MSDQNYGNHARYVPLYHFVLFGIIFLSLIGSIVNLTKSCSTPGFYSASLLTVVFVCLLLFFIYCRYFPLKVQDRAIRAEENLRHFAMTGKLIDSRITMGQIISLRFASDEEFLELCKKAAEEKLSPKQIKQAIRKWRADEFRA